MFNAIAQSSDTTRTRTCDKVKFPQGSTTQGSTASKLLCTYGVYQLELLQNNRQFPDRSVIEGIVQIRCKIDQTHDAALLGGLRNWQRLYAISQFMLNFQIIVGLGMPWIRSGPG